MKKIAGIVAAASMLSTSVFAEVSWSAAANVSADIVTYESVSRSDKKADRNKKGTDDTGKITWGKDVVHGEDVTLNASGDNAGAEITFSVEGSSDGSSTSVSIGGYHLWADVLPRLKLHAGTYDTELQAGINDDGEWDNTLSALTAPGLFDGDIADFTAGDGTGDKIGINAANVTLRLTATEWNNFMAEYAVNDNITAYAAMFLSTSGWSDGDWTHDSHVSRFSPWAVAANVKLNEDSKVSFVVKNESSQKLTVAGLTYKGVTEATDDTLAKLLSGTKHGYIYADNLAALAVSGGYSTWSANVDYGTKIADWDLEAAYTFAGLFYDKYDTLYGHHASFYTRSESNMNGYNIADKNIYAHAFDLRGAGKIGDKISITAIANLTYRQPTKYDIHHTDKFGAVKYNFTTKTLDTAQAIADRTTYKNEKSYNVAKGLSGQLAHYESVSFDYAFNSQLTFQVQALHQNSNVYAVGEESESYVRNAAGTVTKRSAILASLTGLNESYFKPRKEIDPLVNSTVTVRPAAIYQISENASLSCGVQFEFTGFTTLKKNSASDNFKTTVSVPVTFKLDL